MTVVQEKRAQTALMFVLSVVVYNFYNTVSHDEETLVVGSFSMLVGCALVFLLSVLVLWATTE